MNLPFSLSPRFSWNKKVNGDERQTKSKMINKQNISSGAPFISAGKGIKAGGSIIVGNTTNLYAQAKAEKQIAHELITFLENKRVLYNSSAWEVPDQCVDAVFDMRRFLTEKISETTDQQLLSCLKSIRRACIDFLNINNVARGSRHQMNHRRDFELSLDRLRNSTGHALHPIVKTYNLEVEKELASIIPN